MHFGNYAVYYSETPGRAAASPVSRPVEHVERRLNGQTTGGRRTGTQQLSPSREARPSSNGGRRRRQVTEPGPCSIQRRVGCIVTLDGCPARRRRVLSTMPRELRPQLWARRRTSVVHGATTQTTSPTPRTRDESGHGRRRRAVPVAGARRRPVRRRIGGPNDDRARAVRVQTAGKRLSAVDILRGARTASRGGHLACPQTGRTTERQLQHVYLGVTSRVEGALFDGVETDAGTAGTGPGSAAFVASGTR